MTPEAKKLADEILQICRRKATRDTLAGRIVKLDDILVEFSKADKPAVKSLVKHYLVKMNYLQKVDDDPIMYAITKRGEIYLDSLKGGLNIHVGDNSNVAYNSPYATQTIRIGDQSEEMQQLIEAFNQAIQQKDSSALKKTFGYIADKSVDVAIAMATGVLLR